MSGGEREREREREIEGWAGLRDRECAVRVRVCVRVFVSCGICIRVVLSVIQSTTPHPSVGPCL